MNIRVTHNTVTPALERLNALLKNPEPILTAVGQRVRSITEGNFNTVGAAFRPATWAPKKDGSPSILQKSTTLARSFHLTYTQDSVTLKSPVVYAAIHQSGGEIRPKAGKALKFQSGGRWWTVKKVTMPARPFVPIKGKSGELTDAAAASITKTMERVIRSEVDPGQS